MELYLKFIRFTSHNKRNTGMTLPKFKFKSTLLIVFISTALFTSCKDKEQVTEVNTSTPQAATLEQKRQALENVSPSSNNGSSNGDVAINPAHGQPGHRCDILVGAPLNGTEGIKVSPTKMNQTNSAPAASPSSNNGINPAHGQPGHRCDIKVGDPL